MPKVTPLRSDLPEREKLREEHKRRKKIRPGSQAKLQDIIRDILERLEAIEKILDLD